MDYITHIDLCMFEDSLSGLVVVNKLCILNQLSSAQWNNDALLCFVIIQHTCNENGTGVVRGALHVAP